MRNEEFLTLKQTNKMGEKKREKSLILQFSFAHQWLPNIKHNLEHSMLM